MVTTPTAEHLVPNPGRGQRQITNLAGAKDPELAPSPPALRANPELLDPSVDLLL